MHIKTRYAFGKCCRHSPLQYTIIHPRVLLVILGIVYVTEYVCGKAAVPSYRQ